VVFLVLILLFVWVSYNWAQTLLTIKRFYIDLPVWDYWTMAANFLRYKALDFRVLWEQHNEHRLVFPGIVIAIDALLMHGREFLPLAVSFGCYFGVWLVISLFVITDRGLSLTNRLLAVVAAGFLMSWPGSAFVLAVPFLMQWPMLQFASIAALGLLAIYGRTAQRGCLYGVILSGTVATYSSGNGMVLWPLLFAFALLLHLGRRDLVILGVAAVLNIGLYFVNYRHSEALNLMNFILHPQHVWGFVATYVAVPFGVRDYGTAKGALSGLRIGSANLIVLLLLAVICWRKDLARSAPAIVLLGYSAFSVLSALLTAAGRMSPEDSLYIGATAIRYLSMPLANWGTLAAAGIWVLGRTGGRWRNSLPWLATALILFYSNKGFSGLKGSPWIQMSADAIPNQQWAALSVESGLANDETDWILFPDEHLMRYYLPTLRENRLAVFYRGESSWIGEPLAKHFPPPVPFRAAGHINYTFPLAAGVEVVGWSSTEGKHGDSGHLYFVDEVGRIIGLGRRLPAGLPTDLRSLDLPKSLAWVGFVNPTFKSKSFRTYLSDWRGGYVMEVGAEQRIPGTK
jgi:hypothetical protein